MIVEQPPAVVTVAQTEPLVALAWPSVAKHVGEG